MFSLLRTYWPSVSRRVEALTPQQALVGVIAAVVVAMQLQEHAANAANAALALSRSHPLVMGIAYIGLVAITLAHARDDVKDAPRGSPKHRLGSLSAGCYIASVTITFVAAMAYMWSSSWPDVVSAPNIVVLVISLAFHAVNILFAATLVALASPAFLAMMALASFVGLLPGMTSSAP